MATWRKCRRKWAYTRVRPYEETESTRFGGKVHEARELWLRDGLPPDPSTEVGRVALPGLDLLPAPGTCGVEVDIRGEYEGAHYYGRADVIDTDGVKTHVHDHKSCRTWDYALTEEEALEDEQYIFYAFFGGRNTGAEEVRMTWHYLRRQPAPACKPVSVCEPFEKIAERWDDLHKRVGLPIYQELVRTNRKPNPEDYPRSLDHCGAYGGCRYASECLEGVSVLERARAAMEKSMPPNLQEHLANNAKKPPTVPDQLISMIRDGKDFDIEAAAKHYGTTVEALRAMAEPEPVIVEQKPPKAKKPRKKAPPKPSELVTSPDDVDRSDELATSPALERIATALEKIAGVLR